MLEARPICRLSERGQPDVAGEFRASSNRRKTRNVALSIWFKDCNEAQALPKSQPRICAIGADRGPPRRCPHSANLIRELRQMSSRRTVCPIRPWEQSSSVANLQPGKHSTKPWSICLAGNASSDSRQGCPAMHHCAAAVSANCLSRIRSASSGWRVIHQKSTRRQGQLTVFRRYLFR